MEQSGNTSSSDLRPDYKILIPTSLTIFAVCIPFIFFPEASQSVLKSIFSMLTTYLGSVFLWISLAFVGLALYFIFSKYGNIKFGEEDEKPAFSDISWIAMMFCTGVAGAVMYWSVAEPLFDLAYPPMFAEPFSKEAYEWATTYVLFHWGPLTWSWYVICAIPICYMYYKRKRPVLRISTACEDVLGKRVNGPLGSAIDSFFCIGLVTSNAAVMAISVPIIAFSLSETFGVEPSMGLQLMVLATSTIIFSASVAAGLEKGIANLSYVNLIIAISLISFAFIVGPTTYIVDNFTNAFGMMLGNFFHMSLWTDPHTSGAFPQNWTVFYALWMASYGPFMGLFIARISKGRTIRQIVSMGLIFGMLGGWLIHGVFGGYTLNLQLTGALDAVSILQDFGPPMAVVKVLSSLPGGTLILLAYCVFSTIFLATSVDSAAFALSTACTRKLGIGDSPTVGHRFFWAFLQAVLPASMLFVGGIGPMKTFANVAGALMILVIIPMVLSLFKMLKEEDPIRLKYPDIADKLERLDKLEALTDVDTPTQEFKKVS